MSKNGALQRRENVCGIPSGNYQLSSSVFRLGLIEWDSVNIALRRCFDQQNILIVMTLKKHTYLNAVFLNVGKLDSKGLGKIVSLSFAIHNDFMSEPRRNAILSFQTAKLVNAETQEKDDNGKVSFRFWDGYDYCASAGTHEVFPEAVSNEAVSVVAVEVDVGEVGSEI
jgi:hypothetical protein